MDTLEALRQRIDELETAARVSETRARRQALGEAARIPPQHQSAVFLEAVHTADTDERAVALIEDRKRLVHHQVPVAGLRVAATEIKSVGSFLSGGQ